MHAQRHRRVGSTEARYRHAAKAVCVWLCLLRITTQYHGPSSIEGPWQYDADQIDRGFNADQPRRVD